MSTVTLTEDNFVKTIEDSPIVFVDFWAAWCGPCRMFGPVFEEASQDHPDVVFGKVDTEDQQGLASALGITSIPTVMAFRDGIGVYSQPGAMQSSGFEELIAAVENLDMDEVRAKIAAQQESLAK